MRYEFADYSFDPEVGLDRAGKAIHLAPKETRVLRALLEASGRILSKDAIAATVWGDRAVSDASLFRTIYRLRLAMPADGSDEIIRTVYGTGFQLAVPVRVAPAIPTRSALSPTRPGAALARGALSSARELAARRTPMDVAKALEVARQVVAADPACVDGWTALGQFHLLEGTRGLRSPNEAARLAITATESALALDPDASAALGVQGWARAAIELDFQGGLRDLDRAIEIDPEYGMSHFLLGWVKMGLGRRAEAVESMATSIRLNPHSGWTNAQHAYHLWLAGRPGEALDDARAWAERFPTIDTAHCVLAVIASQLGLHECAIAAGRKARDLAPDTPLMHAALAEALARANRFDEAQAVVSAIEAAPLPAGPAMVPVYLALGDRARAVATLRKVREQGWPQLLHLINDPRVASLHADPAVADVWRPLRDARDAVARETPSLPMAAEARSRATGNASRPGPRHL